MSNDLNQCNFIGRLGKDCEVRYAASGDAIASFSIAIGSQWKNKSGEKQESTEWVNVTAFGKLGEICGEYLRKGSQVFISGRMKTDKYTDKQGVEKYSTKIIADRLQMLGGKPQESGVTDEQMRNRKAAREVNKPSDPGSFEDFRDNIPF